MHEQEPPASISTHLSAAIAAYTPQVLGAILVLIIGLGLAWLLARGTRILVLRTGLDERIARALGHRRVGRLDAAGAAGRAVFHGGMAIVILTALHTLGIPALTAPIDHLLAEVFAFVPRLLGASLLGLLAWGGARAARASLSALLVRRTGPSGGVRGEGRAPFADVAYWLVLFLFLPAILAALDVEGVLSPVSALVEDVLEIVPRVAAAAVVMALAYVVGRSLSTFLARLLERVAFDERVRRLGVVSEEQRAARAPSTWAGQAAFGGALLLGTVEAGEVLGLETAALLLSDLAVFFARALLALFLFGGALWLSQLAARAATSGATSSGAGEQAPLLAFLARGIVIVLGGVFALEALGLDSEVLGLVVGVSFGAVALGFALAVGLGGRELAGRELERVVRRLRGEGADAGSIEGAEAAPERDDVAPEGPHAIEPAASSSVKQA